ncbi:ATP-binding cassette domain-containing protein [Thauera aminoaromatica]|uniref:ATP-binding cassette domain-containing protein n=1 Tax=Thauera aminoaromatica TaxID=164330 RepID=A0A5C7SG42_THASP|nr:ATP-binding cassette domain-containing protein [Thauera aminoaromatica]TXH81895.1 MAG: ATP-binding cassette domain-containing protein [Thauera aminoaromatica]
MQLDLDLRKTLNSGRRTFTLQVRLQSNSQRIVIVGPSGSGKSLTLKAIAGLLRPDAGYIRLDGRVLFDAAAGVHLPPQQREVAYVFQDYALFPHLTVRQNIAFSLAPGWLNPRPRHRDDTVEYWLDAFRLRALADQFPSELSGGQRQRTALARALVSRPRALLLDEPFSALDPALRVAMRDELDELQQRLQVPMVLITHDPEDAAVFGDHVLNLQDGRLEAIEPVHAMEVLAASPPRFDALSISRERCGRACRIDGSHPGSVFF